MDTLTHALSGALLVRATEAGDAPARALSRATRMWVGFWAAAFPDSDFVLRFIDPLMYLTTHRGVTHSVVLLPVWALALGVTFFYLTRRRYSWRALTVVAGLGIGAHIVGDVITAFGTMMFAPLSLMRVAWPTTFIIDPYFSVIIIAGLIASARWPSTRKPAVIGLALLAGYVGFQGLLHQRALDIGRAHAARTAPGARVHALPQPFTPFHWLVVVEQPERYDMAYVSLWRTERASAPPADASWLRQHLAVYDPPAQARWREVPRYGDARYAPLAQTLWESDVLAAYRHFALLPALYAAEVTDARQCLWFEDLRFALVGREMPFRYGACREGERWQVHRYGEGPAPARDRG